MALTNDAQIKAVITADDRASATLKRFGDNVDGIGGKIAAGLKVAAIGLAAGGAAATAFGVLSVKAFSESEDAIAQTNAVLKSTGSVAGVTADEVTKLATALQKTTKFSDEEVRSAENLLLTFTSIGKDIFPQATKTVLDMATALGEDTKSASIQLGKALQDPVLGITALRRVGVNFSEAQKDVIANLVETGRKAEAQKLILKELQVEFGGSAEAAGKTFAGSLAILKNQFNDIQETIGQTIVNAITPFTGAMVDAINSVDWTAVINNTIASLSNFWNNYLKPLILTLQEFATKVYTFLQPSLDALSNTLETRLVPVLQRLWHEVLEPLMPVLGVALAGALWLIINVLNIVISTITFLVNAILNLIKYWEMLALKATLAVMTIMQWIGTAAQWIGDRIQAIRNWFNSLPDGIRAAVSGIYEIITAPFRRAFNDIVAGVERVKRSVGSIKGGAANLAQDIADPFNLFHRAGGGDVTAGQPYIVGEQGQELFVPSSSGTIIPNHELNSGGGGSTVNITVQAGAFLGSDVEARKFAQIILRNLQDIAGAKSMTVGQMLG